MPVTAADLAGADIVITTYSVLRRDVDFEAGGTTVKRSARHVCKYPVLPTPLTRLTWWRVILDEAQMVEGASKAAEMAASLSMVNRWCVTGTPISHGLADVYGLVRFLQVPPALPRTPLAVVAVYSSCTGSAPARSAVRGLCARSTARLCGAMVPGRPPCFAV